MTYPILLFIKKELSNEKSSFSNNRTLTTIVSYAADKMEIAMPAKVSARSTILYSPTSPFK